MSKFRRDYKFRKFGSERFFWKGVLGTPSIELVPNRTDLRDARAEAFKRILATGTPEYFDNSPRIDETGNEVPVNVWAFRYYLNRNPSVGAKLDSSTTK
jgi:hypothetical protein